MTTTGEKRGKVDVGAKARAAPGTSRLPVRERGRERARGRPVV